MTKKAVLFDLDGTLYDRDELVGRLLAAQYDAFTGGLTSISKEVFTSRLRELDDRGYRDKRDVYRMAAEEWDLAPQLRDRLYRDFWSRYDEHCALDADVDRTLSTLRNRRLKLAVVTNGLEVRQRRKMDALGITTLFDAILISEVEGVKKPDIEIFGRALARCGVAPSEALFVGDHPEIDIAGALRAGIPAVWKAVPYWSCTHDVPRITQLSEVLRFV